MSKEPRKNPKAQTELTDEELDKVSGAGDAGTYTGNFEAIRDGLDSSSGAALGDMVGAQTQLTESKPTYQVQSGVPTKVSKAHRAAAAPVRRDRG